MSEFNLSEKELKALLQSEGLEEPSLSFNRDILEKAKAIKKTPALTIPLWVKALFGVLVIAPLVYLSFFTNAIDAGLQQLELNKPELSLNIGLSNTYQYILLMAVGTVWMALLFNKFLNHQHKVKKG